MHVFLVEDADLVLVGRAYGAGQDGDFVPIGVGAGVGEVVGLGVGRSGGGRVGVGEDSEGGEEGERGGEVGVVGETAVTLFSLGLDLVERKGFVGLWFRNERLTD